MIFWMIAGAIAALALIAMAAASSVVAVPALRDQVSIFSTSVRFSPWWWRLPIDGGLATLTMLPPTLFMGLSCPLASRLFLGDVRKLGSGVGGAYLLANLGSILGALLAAVVLLPLFGPIGGTKIIATVNLALAVALLVAVRKRVGGWRAPTTAAVV